MVKHKGGYFFSVCLFVQMVYFRKHAVICVKHVPVLNNRLVPAKGQKDIVGKTIT